MSRSNNLLLMLTGSISCFKTCELVSLLKKRNSYEIQLVATPAALKFIGLATLEGLSGRPVVSDIFAEGDMMGHIHWARWADLIVVAPATAQCVNSMAAGLTDSLPGSIFLANNFIKPFWVAPAMNSEMYSHPRTTQSLKTLSGWGCRVLDSPVGTLACGEEGPGRMIEAQDLFGKIEHYFLETPKGKVNSSLGATQ